MARTLVARAPTRLDFGGGWTDVAPYSDESGGAVCNVAIARYATATVAFQDATPTNDARAESRASDEALVRAALRRSSVPGATGLVASDFPVGAGLGGSSAAGVALAGALAALADTPLDRATLAERSRHTEIEDLGVAGGFQDHYAAAFGGALLLTAGPRVQVERLAISEATAQSLARRIILVYTGESRLSALTIRAVADGCRAGDPRVCRALDRMKQLALLMADTLRAGDVDSLGGLVGEHWIQQRALHPSITTPRIDAIDAAASRAGALGMKALGASGGGCVIAVSRAGREEELASALSALGERLSFAIDHTGFAIMSVARERGEEAI